VRLVIEESIEIAAPIEEVWALFGDLSTWPSWNRTCRRAVFVSGAPWRQGSRFAMTMAAGPVPLAAVVEIVEADPPRKVAWRGGHLGVRSDHRWTLTAAETGTRLHSLEVFSGATLPLLRLGGLRCLVGYLSQAWLHGLKAAAERRNRRL
jgi:uncharacterized protein YndB with AHSA1/START domain